MITMGILSFLPRPGIPQYTWNEQTQEWSSPVQEAGKNCKMYLETVQNTYTIKI